LPADLFTNSYLHILDFDEVDATDVQLAANKEWAMELTEELQELNRNIVKQETIQTLRLQACEKQKALEKQSNDLRIISILVCIILCDSKVPLSSDSHNSKNTCQSYQAHMSLTGSNQR
jgi:hypothetical protein